MEMEYAEGGTLQNLMRRYRQKHFKDEDCATIVRSILKGLQHIHWNDYVHRDLKPSNIVIGEECNYDSMKLVDFGLAVKQ
jgi:serine/threonine protein kinase